MDFDSFKCLSFDCYGTLIDWETGLLAALRPIFGRYGAVPGDQDILESYAAAETDIESSGYRPYRQVLREVLSRLGDQFGFAPDREELDQFSLSVKDWPPFPDSPEALAALQQKYRLVILSNIDDDSFQHSARRLGIDFDDVFTAQQIRSYKPSDSNFRYLLENAGIPSNQILHVAQSLFHDITPAKRAGLATVWVNRRSGQSGAGATPAARAEPDLEV
ncbi:MAG: haloacid dehalogenase type II, partial [Gemmatimonadales bacterium]